MKIKDKKILKKTYQLLALLLLLCIVIYKFGISNTHALYQENNKLQTQINSASKNPNGVSSLKQKVDSLEASMAIVNIDTVRFQHKIIEECTRLCVKNNCSLVKMPKTIQSSSNNYLVETYMLSIKGSYFNLMHILDEWEKIFGHLASVKFEYLNDNNLESKKLILTIYIQNINKNE